MLTSAALCFSLLFSAVLGFPLTQRDVVSPHITNPHAGSVWVVGQQEIVTWETDNLPPDSQITNPNGRVILGFQANNSLNLQLDHPLAQNFKLRAGMVTITVPNVPPRDDYIIVLMGDSGNASPAFAITSIKGGFSSLASTPNGSSAPTSSDNSPPFTGSIITGGTLTTTTDDTSTDDTASASTPMPTPTAPASLPALSSNPTSPGSPSTASSGSASVTVSAAPASTSTPTSAAWSVHSYQLWPVIVAPLSLVFLV